MLGTSAHAEDAGALRELPGCQAVGGITEIRNTDQKLASFTEAEISARTAIDAYDKSCGEYNKAPSLATDLILSTIPKQMAEAVSKVGIAGRAFQLATQSTDRTYGPVRRMRNASCEAQLRSSFDAARTKWRALEARGAKLKSCITPAKK